MAEAVERTCGVDYYKPDTCKQQKESASDDNQQWQFELHYRGQDGFIGGDGGDDDVWSGYARVACDILASVYIHVAIGMAARGELM